MSNALLEKDSPRGRQMRAALRRVEREGHGAIVYQQQEGRGIGILNKIRAYALQDEGADTVEANERLGLEVVERVALEVEPHDGFARYLRTKRERMGHLIHPARWGTGVNARGQAGGTYDS